jgi:hypothetical protein
MTNKEQGKKIGQIITKAWADQAFKERLLADATAVLKEQGLAVPEGVTVKAVENSDKVFHIILPQGPEGKMSDEELDTVAAGRAGDYTEGFCTNLMWGIF